MDNRYFKYKCPPLMNDGRFISNYIRSSTFDQYIRNSNNIESSNDFRHHIQNNGAEIMNNMKGYYRKNNTCSVEGRCLPMSGSEVPKIDTAGAQIMWYEDLLDQAPPQLDFMMTNNNVISNTINRNVLPTQQCNMYSKN